MDRTNEQKATADAEKQARAQAEGGKKAQADADKQADADAKAAKRIADLEAELADARAAAQPHGGTVTANAKGEVVSD